MIKLQKFDILYDSTVRTSPEFLKKVYYLLIQTISGPLWSSQEGGSYQAI